MKNRFGFVSNSSSSSFIVACKPNNTKITIEIEIDLKDFTDKSFDNVHDFIKYFEYDYCLDDIDEEHLDIRKKVEKCVAEGKHIFMGSFSSDSDNSISAFLCEYGIPQNTKNVDIIENDPGY